MEINAYKSQISFNKVTWSQENIKVRKFYFQSIEFIKGFKHLGFVLKQNDYRFRDCILLYQKVEKKDYQLVLSVVVYWWKIDISKSILEVVLVYQLLMAYILIGLVEKVLSFLMDKKKRKNRMAFVKWKKIMKPSATIGWGLK